MSGTAEGRGAGLWPSVSRVPARFLLSSEFAFGLASQGWARENRLQKRLYGSIVCISTFGPSPHNICIHCCSGNIPGSHWKKPFICPADHVLDLEGGWHNTRPEFGAHLHYREYSFFNNPR